MEELLENEAIKLPWGVRMKIIRDIVSGMVYLHSKNVFHRDLNPKVRYHGVSITVSMAMGEEWVEGGADSI